jgi:hypothetical protein
MSSTPIPSRHLLVRLQQDWDRLKRNRRAIEQARQWSLPPTPTPYGRPLETLETLDDVLAWVGYGCSSKSCDDDPVLAALVRLAVDDQLAARVILQRLLPGISSMARRHAALDRPYSDVLDDVMASAWTVIRTYPVDRRCTYVAAGLLREIDYFTFRRPLRRLATFVPRPVHTFEQQPHPHTPTSASDELRDLLDDAVAAGVDPDDIEFARRLGRGDSTRSLALSADTTERTVRNRRDSVTYRLRAVALAAA